MVVALVIAFLFIAPNALGTGLSTALTETQKSKVPKHCAMGDGPEYPAYDPADGYIYVPNSESGTVYAVKTPCNAFASWTFLPGSSPGYAAFDPQDNYVYVTDFGLNEVYVLSGTTLVATLGGGWFSEPEGIVYDPAGLGMLVANAGSDNLTWIIGTTVQPFLSLPAGPEQISIDPVFGSIDVTLPALDEFATAGPNIPIYYLPTTVYYWSTGTSSNPAQIAYDPATGTDFVTDSLSNNLTIFYAGVPETFPASSGNSPLGLCYSTKTQDMDVVNFGSSSVWEINPGFGVSKKVSLGTNVAPVGCTYDDATGQIYVTGFQSDQLYYFD